MPMRSRLKRIYERDAEKGVAVAMFLLGIRHETGDDCDQNPETAIEWYRKAADQDDADAMYRLGLCLDKGNAENLEEAAKWYKRAADKGHAEAQLLWILCRLCGIGDRMNLQFPEKFFAEHEGTFSWLKSHAETGVVGAQYQLGRRYEMGGNREKAIEWYSKAAYWNDEARQAWSRLIH